MNTTASAILGLSLTILGFVLGARSSADDGPVCYAVANIEIHDRDEYRKYEAGFSAIFEKYGGTIVAGSEEPEVLEGEWPYTRFVLLSFPSRQALETWYRSEEYQGIVPHRWAASDADIILVDGRR